MWAVVGSGWPSSCVSPLYYTPSILKIKGKSFPFLVGWRPSRLNRVSFSIDTASLFGITVDTLARHSQRSSTFVIAQPSPYPYPSQALRSSSISKLPVPRYEMLSSFSSDIVQAVRLQKIDKDFLAGIFVQK